MGNNTNGPHGPANVSAICPTCGAPAQEGGEPKSSSQTEKSALPGREYDHRGVLMPKRTPVGGIIIPQ